MDQNENTATALLEPLDDIEWGDEPDDLACGIENPDTCESCT